MFNARRPGGAIALLLYIPLNSASAPANTLALYQFNGGTNGAAVPSLVDSGPNSLNGTVTGSLKYSTNVPSPALFGSSALDATADLDFATYSDTTNAFHTAVDFTVEAFAKPHYTPGVNDNIGFVQIVAKLWTEDSGNNLATWYLAYDNNAHTFATEVSFGGGSNNNHNNGVYLNSTHAFPNDQWYHVAATYQHVGTSGVLKIYVNNFLENSVTVPYQAPIYTALPFYVGAANYAGTNGQFRRNFAGHIDSVRISDTALSPGQFLLPPGDLNFDGVLNADDYSLIDRGLAKHLTGYANGDLNNDGTVNAADYLLLDTDLLNQGGHLAPTLLAQRESQFGPTYVTTLLASVPEPLSLSSILYPLSSLLLLPRRRHHH